MQDGRIRVIIIIVYTSKVHMFEFTAGKGTNGRIHRDGAKIAILWRWRCCTESTISALVCVATITLFIRILTLTPSPCRCHSSLHQEWISCVVNQSLKRLNYVFDSGQCHQKEWPVGGRRFTDGMRTVLLRGMLCMATDGKDGVCLRIVSVWWLIFNWILILRASGWVGTWVWVRAFLFCQVFWMCVFERRWIWWWWGWTERWLIIIDWLRRDYIDGPVDNDIYKNRGKQRMWVEVGESKEAKLQHTHDKL